MRRIGIRADDQDVQVFLGVPAIYKGDGVMSVGASYGRVRSRRRQHVFRRKGFGRERKRMGCET